MCRMRARSYAAALGELAGVGAHLDAWLAWASGDSPPPPGSGAAWVAAHRAVFAAPSTVPALRDAADAVSVFFGEVRAS